MGIARAALIIMLGNVASRLLGVVREQVVAGLFGLTDAADAFSAASRVTTPVYDLLIGGMISAALIPVFSGYTKRESEPELWALVSIVLNLIIVIFVVFTLTLIFLAPQLMLIFGSGYSPAKQAEAVGLVRVMLVSLIFMGCSGVLTAVYYSRRRFSIPALCGSVYNMGIAGVAVLLHNQMGVTSLAVGTLVGAALQVAVLVPGLRKMRMRYTLRVSLSHPAVRRIIALYLPVAAGLLISFAAVAVDSNLASKTGMGNLAAMRFATTLIQLPLGLVAVAMGFAVLPTLSRYATGFANGRDGSVAPVFSADSGEDPPAHDSETSLASFKTTLALGIKMMIVAIIPATVGLAVIRIPLIQLLFQHGVFNADDTATTGIALLAYLPGLPAAALDQLLIFAFYARRNTITPVLVGITAIGVYLAVALSLLGPLGMPGLALANSAQWTAHALIMLVLGWIAFGGLQGLGIRDTLLKVAAASVVMAAVLMAVMGPLRAVVGEGTPRLMLYLALLCGLGAGSYVICLVVLRVQEVGTLWDMVKAKMAGSTAT